MNDSITQTQMACIDVIRFAHEALAWVTERRKLDVERWIQRHMKEDQRGFWDCLFRRPKVFPTREQAEKAVHESSRNSDGFWCPSPYQTIQSYYVSRETLAKRLIKLANVSTTGHIIITLDDVDLLLL